MTMTDTKIPYTYIRDQQQLVQANKNYYLYDTVHKAGTTYPMHWHTAYEIEIIVTGEVEYKYNMTSFTARQGDVFFISPLDRHDLKINSSTRIISIAFTENMLYPELALFISKNSISNHIHFKKEQLRRIVQIAE